MKTRLMAATAAAGALAILGMAAPASATQYVLNDIGPAAFTLPLGTVDVTGQGSNVLTFDVSLANNVYFQQLGSGALHDSFWFDLTGQNGSNAVAYNITAPNADGLPPGGDFGNGGVFSGAPFSANHYGQGFLMGGDYAIQVQDPTKPINFYSGHLTFTVTAATGSHLDVAPLTGTDIAGADLRQCTNADCTTVIATGPVGARLAGGVPEPATWAMMLVGFGGMGALLRRRRSLGLVAAA